MNKTIYILMATLLIVSMKTLAQEIGYEPKKLTFQQGDKIHITIDTKDDTTDYQVTATIKTKDNIEIQNIKAEKIEKNKYTIQSKMFLEKGEYDIIFTYRDAQVIKNETKKLTITDSNFIQEAIRSDTGVRPQIYALVLLLLVVSGLIFWLYK